MKDKAHKKSAKAKETHQAAPAGADEVGEGNHAADQRYREATERFIAEGKVAPAAAEAVRALDDKKERRALEEAEARGRAPAAGRPEAR
jgi:hypothetical protein